MMLDSVLNSKNKEYLGKILFGLSILILFGMVYIIFHKFFLTNDEYFTLGLIKLPVDYGIYITSMDVHPPFYYLIVKFFATLLPIGDSNYNLIIVSKLISLIPYVVILSISGLFFRKKYGWFTCGLISFTLALMSGFFINYIIMRMYSWCVLFLLLSFLSMYFIITENKNKYWILFTLFTILGAYTHYFNAVSSIMLYLLLLTYLIYNKIDFSQIKLWFVSTVAVILAYLPWVSSLFSQLNRVNDGYWIPPITLQTVFDYFAYSFTISDELMVKLFAVLMLIFICIIIFKLYSKQEKEDNFYYISGISVFLLTLFVGVAISIIKEPVIYDRYLLASISLIMVIMSIVLGKMRNNKIIVVLLCVLLLFSMANVYEDYHKINENHDKYLKHEKFFNKTNNNESIFIFKDSISLLRFESLINNSDIYCEKNRFDDNLHKYIDFKDLKTGDIDDLIKNNPNKKIYYVSNDKLPHYDNHKEVHLFSNLKIYSISKQGE